MKESQAAATEDEVKKAFRKHAMIWYDCVLQMVQGQRLPCELQAVKMQHPPSSPSHRTTLNYYETPFRQEHTLLCIDNYLHMEREERTNKMKEINSAYVCLTQGEDEQEEDFPDGFPWSMPDEVLASLMEQLFASRMGGFTSRRGGAHPRGSRPQPFFPMEMGFPFPEPVYDDRAYGCPGHWPYDDEDSDDSQEYYPTGRGHRRRSDPRKHCSEEDLEKNRRAERNLEEHQKREAARLACDKQKASVMKLIGKLAKPTKTEITDSSISLTIDRNKKLRGELPTGGFWELQCRMANARGTDRAWAPVATRLHKTTVKVGNLVPGTQYDFRARGGYHSELPGAQDTLGDFSVVSTLQTTGTKPGKAEEAACEGEKQKQPAAEDSKPKKKEKPGKGARGAQKPAEEAQEEARADEEAQKKAARAEEEARKKAQREAVLKAKREKEAQVAAAEAAKRRQQEAKRDADRKLAMQMRLEREAEEYQRLMAEHACPPGDAPDKGPKKKKKKKKTKAEEPSQPAANQQQDEGASQAYSHRGMAAEYEQWGGAMHDGVASGLPDGPSTLSAEAEAIRAEAVANGLGCLGDEELQTLIEQQRAIEEECAQNLAKQKQAQAARAPAAPASQPAQGAVPAQSTASGRATLPAQRKMPAQRAAPGRSTAAAKNTGPSKSTAQAKSTGHSKDPVPPHAHQQQPSACRDEPTHAAPKPSGTKFSQQQREQNGSRNGVSAPWTAQQSSSGAGGKRGGASGGAAHADSHHTPTGVFNDGSVDTAPLDVDGSKLNGQHGGGDAYWGVSEPHVGDENSTFSRDVPGAMHGVGAARGGNAHMQSPDSGASSQSAASLGAFQGGGAPEVLSHRRMPPPQVPPASAPHVGTHAAAYRAEPRSASVATAGGWHASNSMHAPSQHVNHAASMQQHSQQVPESWSAYAQQGMHTASMHSHHDEHVQHTDNTLNQSFGECSGYGLDGHHGQYQQYPHDFGTSYSTDASGWQATPPPQWNQSEHTHSHAHSHSHQYGPIGHGGQGVSMHGQHAAQPYEASLWASPQGDPAMLQQQNSTSTAHMAPGPGMHAQHAQGLWGESPASAMQPPLNPDAAAHPTGRRMHAQSNPSSRGALYQAYSKRNPGAGGDSWTQNGTSTGSLPISEPHGMLHAHAPQRHAPLSAKAPLFDHTARFTPTERATVTPEPPGVHLPEDLLEPSNGASCGSNHMEGSGMTNSGLGSSVVTPLQFDTRQLNQWAQQSAHHAPPAYPVEWT